MSQLYVGSICLSDIPEEKKQVGRNGKIYVPITLWVNDAVDRYNNIGSIHVSQTQEERQGGALRQYVGNFKVPVVVNVQQNTGQAQAPVPPTDDDTAWNEFLSR